MWTAFLLFGAAASVVAWIAALCHEKGFRPFAGAVRFVRELSWGGRLALLPLFVALVAYGSTKMGEMESKSRVEVEEKAIGGAHSAVQLQLKTSTKIAKPIPLFDFGLELRPLNSIFSFDLKHTTNSCIWSLEGVFVIIEGI